MNLDRRLWREVWRVRGLLATAIGAGLFAALLLVAQAYLLSQAISRVFLGGATLSEIAPLVGVFGTVPSGGR
ncbi:MAG: hypothetical protein KatS3mg051_0101 [Anaerolineae bacterium]|nr:MAG: hypothetical protein KatS3mg051_0101 [Anaerolineae bacterium]